MKFKAVVTVLAQRQRVRRNGEEGEEDEEDEMTRTVQLRARMYSGTPSYLRALSPLARAEGGGWRVFDVLFIICLSHHLYSRTHRLVYVTVSTPRYRHVHQ